MTEDKVLAGNFVFISYSHADIDAVREDVRILHSRGARIWFDENMRLSDNWKEIAREKLTHPNCKGAIFYNSKAAILSGAVSLERQIVTSRMKTDAEFGYWSVNVDGKTMQDIYAEAMVSAPTNFLSTLQYELLPMFNDDILYIPRTPKENFAERIFEEICKKRMVVDDTGLVITKLEETSSISKDTKCYSFGAYINEKYPIPLRHEKPNERFTINATEYISKDNQIYTVRPLQWKILYVEDAVAVLLCNEIICGAYGGDCLSEFLTDVFNEIAFSATERAKLASLPRLLTLHDIEKAKEKSTETEFKSSLLLGTPPNPYRSHWWIDASGLLENWQMTYCNDKPFENGFVISVKKGVRPVIELPVNQLQLMKEDK